MQSIKICKTDEEIDACFPVIQQLRPHLVRATFVSQVRRLNETQGFKLVSLSDEGGVRAVMGMRIAESLAWAKFVYVDDLVTDQTQRSSGWGKALLDWATELGKAEQCGELHLDSGVMRYDAHRFYLRERMDITCHHFKKSI
ncbi:MAG TPA: GNAT family N-acetyltransferase [Polyangiales bacterium]